MPGPEVLRGRRVAAPPAALDAVTWPAGSMVLRLAPDEVFVTGAGDLAVGDTHAIIEEDAGLSTIEIPASEARALLARHCDWELPTTAGVLSQGLIAAVPAKVWWETDRVVVIVATSLLHELEDRLR